MERIAHDLDYTILWTNKTPKPVRICADSYPYIKECYIGKEKEIKMIITGRPESERTETEDLLSIFGIDAELHMNPENRFDMEFIATTKAKFLHIHNIQVYVEDNEFYRHVMAEYWNGKCISSEEWIDLI